MAECKLTIKKRYFNDIYLNYPLEDGTTVNLLNEYKKRVLVFYGGAGSGKSKFAIQRSVVKAIRYPERRFLVIRKVTATIRVSVFDEFKTILSQFGILKLCKVKESDFTITLPNGSEFIFKGMDDPEKIKSIAGITDIIIEEATELSQKDYEQLQLRLRSRKKYNQIVLMYNPISKSNWVYKMFHENGHPDNALVVHTTYKDNRFLPADYVENYENIKVSNPQYYKIYCLGEFASTGKTVYTNWGVADFNYRELIKKGHTAYFGLDWGYTNDPSAFIASVVDRENKKIYIFDEHYEKSMLNSEIARMIIKKGYAKEVITGDSSEPKSIEEVKRSGVRRLKPARKGKDSVLHGIQFLQQFEIIVHPKCVNTKLELENYTWKEDKFTGEYLNTPNDEYNHLLDALRYSLEDVMPRNRMSSFNKALLGL